MPEHRPTEQGQLPAEVDTPNHNPDNNDQTPENSSGHMQTVKPDQGPQGGEVAAEGRRSPGGRHEDEVGNFTIEESAPEQDRE